MIAVQMRLTAHFAADLLHVPVQDGKASVALEQALVEGAIACTLEDEFISVPVAVHVVAQADHQRHAVEADDGDEL